MKIVLFIIVISCSLIFARNAYDRSGNYRGDEKSNGSYSKDGQYRQIKKTSSVYESSNSQRNKNTSSNKKVSRGRSSTILIDKEGNQYRGSQYENKDNKE